MNNSINEYTEIINILNNMYNDNNRQIQSLTESNNEIRNILTNILYSNNSIRQNNNTNINLFNRLINDMGINSRFFNTPNIVDNQIYNIFNTTQYRTTNLTPSTNWVQNFFEPVEIYPTQTQIEIATRRVMYNDIISPVNVSCPITLEPFNDNDIVTLIRHCGHIFNSENLNTWFRSNSKCPVCRYDIRNYNANSSSSNSNDSTNNNGLNTENNNIQQQNSSSINNEERTRTTENSIQGYLDLFLDTSGNLILDSTDPYVILNLLNNLQNRI